MKNRLMLHHPKRWFLAAALAVSVLVVSCGTEDDPMPGANGGTTSILDAIGSQTEQPREPAPSFAVETFNHGAYDLDARIGTPVVVNFWFPSCPPCRAEMPALQAAYEKYGDEVDFIGVQQSTLDSPASAKAFLEELGVTYPNFADQTESTRSDVQIAYEVLSFPTTFFLNRDHTIARTWTGLLTEEKLDEQITALINS
jgi:cytochrome c biogenesis protein CcmG/thiol:disulfide interchange protein DsbE